MTDTDLRRLDKQLRQIQDPFGDGFQALKRILEITADQQRTSVSEIVRKYMTWKWKR